MGYRLAFAGTGKYVDQHFGAARCFQVYDIGEGGYKYVETREIDDERQGDCGGGFERLYEALKDCDMVFACQIGPSAAAFMTAKGKRVFEAVGAVEEIIAQIIEKKLLD
jgi:nitrogen fixation protein NifX